MTNFPTDNFSERKIPRVGGVFEPTHEFSLVNQEIRINKKSSFYVKFPNIWQGYKLPRIMEKEIYDRWLSDQMSFWQNQLNFAVWCATTGCGVSKKQLKNPDPMTRSVFRFHAYYQIRRILSEMSCPMPTRSSFDPLNNGIDKNAFERICSEFGINFRSNFRQKLDPRNGMGYVWYHRTVKTAHGAYRSHYVTTEKIKTKTDTFDSKFQVEGDPVDYLEQTFHRESGYADKSPDGTGMSAVGSFVDDFSEGFTRAGISRINDSIRVYVWAILGAQSQTRSSIIDSDAQKQFLANVEDAIESVVDLPSSIERYRSTLRYAQSKLDFVVGRGLYMLPSNMDLHVGTINGYNNLIQIASDDMKLGFNADANAEVNANSEANANTVSEIIHGVYSEDAPKIYTDVSQNDQLSHDEKKLSLILGATVIGSAIVFFR